MPIDDRAQVFFTAYNNIALGRQALAQNTINQAQNNFNFDRFSRIEPIGNLIIGGNYFGPVSPLTRPHSALAQYNYLMPPLSSGISPFGNLFGNQFGNQFGNPFSNLFGNQFGNRFGGGYPGSYSGGFPGATFNPPPSSSPLLPLGTTVIRQGNTTIFRTPIPIVPYLDVNSNLSSPVLNPDTPHIVSPSSTLSINLPQSLQLPSYGGNILFNITENNRINYPTSLYPNQPLPNPSNPMYLFWGRETGIAMANNAGLDIRVVYLPNSTTIQHLEIRFQRPGIFIIGGQEVTVSPTGVITTRPAPTP